MDSQYYKKNAQLRYQISRELDIYKKKKEADGDRYEPVIKSILSAAMSVGTTFLGHIADKTDNCCVFLIPIILLLLLLFWWLVFKFIFYLWHKVKDFFCSVNKKAFKKLKIQEGKALEAKFDFDISGLIYLSYIIATDNTPNDKVLLEYNKSEALFYIDRALNKLRTVFVSNVTFKPKISEYRIKKAMDLLLSAIQSLLASTDNKDDDIYDHISNAATTYNNIADKINEKYKGINITKA